MAFQAIKPHCVAFLQHVALNDPSNLRDLPGILIDLSRALQNLHSTSSEPRPTPPPLASYIFFPFSQFLQINPVALLTSSSTHQNVFYHFLKCLATLVQSVDLDKGVRSQLWTFAVLTLGGPLGSKEIRKTWNQDVQKGTLQVLDALLQKREEALELDIPLPILAHSLNTLLLLIEIDDYDIRLAALHTLELLLANYLKPQDLVPQFLPGIVSTLCKTIVATKANSTVTCGSMACLESAIAASINEVRCRKNDLYETKIVEPSLDTVTSLEAIFAVINGTEEEEEEAAPISANSSNEPGKSPAWLRATSSQIHRALLSLLPLLRQHDSSSVRAAFANLSATLLEYCHKSLLAETVELLLEELLVLSQDTWDEVSTLAKERLDGLLSQKAELRELLARLGKEGLSGLPHSILSHGRANERTLQRQLLIVSAAFARVDTMPLNQLQPERWSRTLLKALEFMPIASRGPTTSDIAASWIQNNSSALLLEDTPSSTSNGHTTLPPYPDLPLANIAPGRTVELLKETIQSLAASLAKSGSTAILEHFLNLVELYRQDSQTQALAASGLWVVNQILLGFTRSEAAIKRENKARLGRDVVEVALRLLEDAEQDTRTQKQSNGGLLNGGDHADEEESPAVEIRPGLSQLDSFVGIGKDLATSTSRPNAKVHSFELHLKALSLQALSGTAGLLQTDFRPSLMYTLYPILRSLSISPTTPSSIVQSSGYVTIRRIAVDTGFDLPAGMIIENVDYLLNSVSANLRGSTSFGSGTIDVLAPSVLICAVDLAGEGVLAHLGDAVEEIFDALDRWHAYDLLVSELLRVLDRLIMVVKPEPIIDSKTAIEVTQPAPDTERELQDLAEWFKARKPKQPMDITELSESTMPETNPRQPFAEVKPLQTEQKGDEEGEEEEEGQSGKQGDEPPITKAQGLVLAILRKCLYFLSHSSPFLRARVLALISSCVPVLTNRSSDLLPEIHRFWPYLLARLDDASESTPSYVTIKCMNLISTLTQYKGDFMNVRILKDVWPRLRKVVVSLPASTGTRSEDRYTDRYRVLLSILQTVRSAVASVPGIKNQDLWDIGIVFRIYLAAGCHKEVKDAAQALFEKLALADADLVWVLLAGSIGKVSEAPFLAIGILESSSMIDDLLIKI